MSEPVTIEQITHIQEEVAAGRVDLADPRDNSPATAAMRNQVRNYYEQQNAAGLIDGRDDSPTTRFLITQHDRIAAFDSQHDRDLAAGHGVGTDADMARAAAAQNRSHSEGHATGPGWCATAAQLAGTLQSFNDNLRTHGGNAQAVEINQAAIARLRTPEGAARLEALTSNPMVSQALQNSDPATRNLAMEYVVNKLAVEQNPELANRQCIGADGQPTTLSNLADHQMHALTAIQQHDNHWSQGATPQITNTVATHGQEAEGVAATANGMGGIVAFISALTQLAGVHTHTVNAPPVGGLGYGHGHFGRQ